MLIQSAESGEYSAHYCKSANPLGRLGKLNIVQFNSFYSFTINSNRELDRV